MQQFDKMNALVEAGALAAYPDDNKRVDSTQLHMIFN